jgi:hypothetical protein
VSWHAADLTCPVDVERVAVSMEGTVDVLVNNAWLDGRPSKRGADSSVLFTSIRIVSHKPIMIAAAASTRSPA